MGGDTNNRFSKLAAPSSKPSLRHLLKYVYSSFILVFDCAGPFSRCRDFVFLSCVPLFLKMESLYGITRHADRHPPTCLNGVYNFLRSHDAASVEVLPGYRRRYITDITELNRSRVLVPCEARVFKPGQGPRMSLGPGAWYGWAASLTGRASVLGSGPGGGYAPVTVTVFAKARTSCSNSPAREIHAGNAVTHPDREKRAMY